MDISLQDSESLQEQRLIAVIDDRLYEEWMEFLYTIWQRIEYL
jgi:hypothetical protein